jgi:hypothetical protein
LHRSNKSFVRIQPSQNQRCKVCSILGNVRTRYLLSVNKIYNCCILLFFRYWESGAILRQKWILIRGFTCPRSYILFLIRMFLRNILKMDFVDLVCHLICDRIPEETRNKKCLFPTTKRTTSGQINLIGTRAEDRIIVTKFANRGQRVWFLLLKILQCQIYEKNVTGCAARSVMSGTVRNA